MGPNLASFLALLYTNFKAARVRPRASSVRVV